MVYSPFWRSHWATVGFKYLSQTVKTLVLLFRWRPSVVFVMTPPVVACFAVWFYAKLAGAKYVIDAHSAALMSKRWTRVLFLHRFASRRAVSTIVTNRHLKDLVESWGGHATIVTDVPVEFSVPEGVDLGEGCNMTLVSSFAYDEPIETFFEAARQLPGVRFHVTGDYRKKLVASVLKKKPENVHLTGFLSDSRYVGLLRESDAVIALTTRDHTMQRGAYEAIYLGKPVITSDFPLLREVFCQGAVHVDPSVDGLVRGIEEMRANLADYTAQAEQLRDRKIEAWEGVADNLRRLTGLEAPQRAVENTEGVYSQGRVQG